MTKHYHDHRRYGWRHRGGHHLTAHIQMTLPSVTLLLLLLLSPLPRSLRHRTNPLVVVVDAAPTMFSIEGQTFTGDWDTSGGATNTITITFDEQGEDPAQFNIDISASCSDSAVSATSGTGTAASSNDHDVVFTNQQNLTVQTTACVDVALYVDGITAAVATRQITYVIDPSQSGSGNAQVTNSDLNGVAPNTQTPQSQTGINGGHTLSFTANVVGTATIQYGETFDVDVLAVDGYDIDVTSISVGTITAEPNGAGYVSSPTNKRITVLLPLSSFLDSEGGSETIDLTVVWKVTGSRRRQLGSSGSDDETALQQYDHEGQPPGQLRGTLGRRRWWSQMNQRQGPLLFEMDPDSSSLPSSPHSAVIRRDPETNFGTTTIPGVKVTLLPIMSSQPPTDNTDAGV